MSVDIVITYCPDYDEFNVPNVIPEDTGYFTNDKDDAIGTSKLVWGKDVQITFKRKKPKEIWT